MVSLPGIVLVDDNKSDLDTLQDSFIRSGYPCFPIHYKNNEPDNITGIDHVNLNMIKPRIIISDLNLQELKVDAINLVAPIADVLEKLAIDGPYILYFWSRNATIVSKVMELIEERYRDKIPYPLHWGVLDKTHFKIREGELTEKVQSLVMDNALFNALLDWESRVSKAAQSTTDSIFKLAKPNETLNIKDFQNKVSSKLETMLAAIGNETVGVLNAAEFPDLAVDLGLSPVLSDHLNSHINEIEDNTWKKAIPEIGRDVKNEVTLSTKLNSFYHIEKVDKRYSKFCRGVFLELQKDVLTDKVKRKKLETRLGINVNDLINEEFLIQIVKAANREIVANSTILGFIEISAECDQAQKKTKLHRYILSALTPLDHDDFNLYGKQNKKSHNGIYRVPDVNIDGTDYMLQLSFKYQIGSKPLENIWFGDALFRLRDQIMTDISFNLAQYISRPGITSFK